MGWQSCERGSRGLGRRAERVRSGGCLSPSLGRDLPALQGKQRIDRLTPPPPSDFLHPPQFHTLTRHFTCILTEAASRFVGSFVEVTETGSVSVFFRTVVPRFPFVTNFLTFGLIKTCTAISSAFSSISGV